MRQIKFLTVCIGLCVSFMVLASASKTEVKEHTSFAVNGMSCQKCEKAIEAHLGKIEGVEQVKADHKLKTVQVTYFTSKTKKATIAAAIEALGFKLGSS